MRNGCFDWPMGALWIELCCVGVVVAIRFRACNEGFH